MNDRLVQPPLAEPLRLPDIEPVLAVGEVVVSLVALGDLEDVQEKDVDGQLRNDNHSAEGEVVLQVSQSDPVVLRYLRLVCERHDE